MGIANRQTSVQTHPKTHNQEILPSRPIVTSDMVFLLLALTCSVLLGFIFKLFARFQIDGFQAIVFNYVTCFLCGWIHLGHFPITADHFDAPWMPYAGILGLVFVSGFNLAALTVRHFGVTIGQILQKMSILLSVPFAVLVYHESAGFWKICGFLFALCAIVLVNWPKRKSAQTPAGAPATPNLLWIPLGTWLLAGLLEILLVRVQKENLTDMSNPTFIITVFGTAGLVGGALAVLGWVTGRLRFAPRYVLAGIILGIPNYGSMFFMLRALDSGLEGSFVFPVANVGIIVATTIGAVTLFAEKLSSLNWLGIALAILAIGLMTT